MWTAPQWNEICFIPLGWIKWNLGQSVALYRLVHWFRGLEDIHPKLSLNIMHWDLTNFKAKVIKQMLSWRWQDSRCQGCLLVINCTINVLWRWQDLQGLARRGNKNTASVSLWRAKWFICLTYWWSHGQFHPPNLQQLLIHLSHFGPVFYTVFYLIIPVFHNFVICFSTSLLLRLGMYLNV